MKPKKDIKTKIKIEDMVTVITGKEKGKQGKVKSIDKTNQRIVIEGINKIKKGIRRTREDQKGGFVDKEASIHISNVMLLDPSDSKPTRIGFKKNDDGRKIRYAKKSKKIIDK